MKNRLIQHKVYVKKSKLHGYGVFAAQNIKKNETIEECYMYVGDGKDLKYEDYYFDVRYNRFSMLSGCGCIYNHSDNHNADYDFDVKKKLFTFYALEPIKKDQEILVSYGEEWFSSRKMKSWK